MENPSLNVASFTTFIFLLPTIRTNFSLFRCSNLSVFMSSKKKSSRYEDCGSLHEIITIRQWLAQIINELGKKKVQRKKKKCHQKMDEQINTKNQGRGQLTLKRQSIYLTLILCSRFQTFHIRECNIICSWSINPTQEYPWSNQVIKNKCLKNRSPTILGDLI